MALFSAVADGQREPTDDRVATVDDAHVPDSTLRPAAARRGALAVRQVDRPAERDEAGFLDRLGERRVRRHPSATVSTVASASIATTPASIRSVTCGPTITRPSSSP